MNIPCGDWRRQLNLGWDSHVIKDMLAFCPHTKRMVGYTHDAFDVDVIYEEFKRKYKVVAADEITDAEEDKELTEINTVAKSKETSKSASKSDLKLGKHYMVFMAQHLTSKDQSMSFMVAMYCVASLTGRWVRVNKRQITSTLAFHGFVVINNSLRRSI